MKQNPQETSVLGPIGNDMKYGFILSKTLRIRIILEIILIQLIFFFFWSWVSTHFYIVCCRRGLVFFSCLITQLKLFLWDLQSIHSASREN